MKILILPALGLLLLGVNLGCAEVLSATTGITLMDKPDPVHNPPARPDQIVLIHSSENHYHRNENCALFRSEHREHPQAKVKHVAARVFIQNGTLPCPGCFYTKD